MKNIFEKFDDYVNGLFFEFMEKLNEFKRTDFNSLRLFFQTFNGVLPARVLINFDILKENINSLNSSYDVFKNSNEDIDYGYFKLQNLLDELENYIKYIENLPIFLKTSRDKIFIVKNPVIDYKVKQNENLEIIAKKFYNDEEKWVDIARENDISYFEANDSDWLERTIKIPINKIKYRDVRCVLDAPIGDYMLGLDIDKTFEFVDDDIKVLDGEETFEQGCGILLTTDKGDVPEFLNFGFLVKEVIGKNLGVLQNATILSEVKRILYSDPTVEFCRVDKFVVEEDALLIDATIVSINNDFLKINRIPVQ